MAKKSKADRSDPKKNKSLAIRNILEKMPGAKGGEIVAAVRSEFGLKVTPTLALKPAFPDGRFAVSA